jgi:hypothetical protein
MIYIQACPPQAQAIAKTFDHGGISSAGKMYDAILQ